MEKLRKLFINQDFSNRSKIKALVESCIPNTATTQQRRDSSEEKSVLLTQDVLAGGNGELKSVDHGWSRDSRCLSRRQGQIFSATTKDWSQTVFAGISAGCARVISSPSPYFFLEGDLNVRD